MKRTAPPKHPKWRNQRSPGDQLRRAADRAQLKAGRALEYPLVRALMGMA